MKYCFSFLLILFLASSAVAQTPAFPTSGDIYLGLKKLNVLGSVLYIAAHPDDENTRLLTYFSKDKLYRTGYLSLTRGDGGQNLIGEEQGVELGLIRTQELLAARRIDGAEQFFSRAFDFGYSKTPDETFTKWDREKILSDVVWVIRKFQPDVIITRFPTTGEGGHGHHTASAILANEAFTAAADPKRFGEQLQYVKPWQARRILWNTFNFGGNNTTADNQFKLDAGGFNPVLGKSYGEIAAESRSQHKSQGFGVARSRGEAIEYFRTTGGDAPSAELTDGIITNWARVKGGDAISQLISNAIATFDFMQPQKSVPQLAVIYQALSAMPDGYWRNQKLKEVKELMVQASGLWAEAFTNTATIAQGDSMVVNVILNNRLGEPIRLNGIEGDAVLNGLSNTALNAPLEKNKNFVLVKKIKVPADAPITQPYWLAKPMSAGYFNVTDQRLIGQPDVQPAATVSLSLTVDGTPLTLDRLPVRYKFSEQVRGELYEPLAIVPPYTVRVDPAFSVASDKGFQETYTAYKDSVSIYTKGNTVVLNKGQLQKLTVTNPVGGSVPVVDFKNPSKMAINSMDRNGIQEYKDSRSGSPLYDAIQIRYDHIPYITYFKPTTHTQTAVAYKTAGKKIGYIVGAGDKVPDALTSMGYDVSLLYEKDMEHTAFQNFDAIIGGVRLFNTADWMAKYYDKLMKYVEDGGNYIVQYSQSGNLIKSKIGPYNFTIANKRITDEGAAVTFLQPGHPVMNYPNKITQADFSGWVQERSTYHADNLDPHYQTIFRMADPGEAPQDNSLVIAKYGKGYFTYCGLVLFRELPAGVPGAYRLMANLIALNKLKPS